jgi:putative ABC transport system substrate-binding protein
VKRFLALIFLLFLLCPPAVFAAEEHLIAVIMANSESRNQAIHTAFVEKSQFFCGKKCRIYVQTPNADTMSLRNSVRKAVALGAELLITYGTAATQAAKLEVPSIPTIFADVYDPGLLGLVSAKTQTGRNMTGIRGDAPIKTLFKYFTEITHAKKLVVLYDINSLEGNLQNTLLIESGMKKDIVVVPLSVANSKDLVPQLKSLPDDVDSFFFALSEQTDMYLHTALAFASARQIPVMTQHSGTAEMGAFMVLETSAQEQGEKLAEIAEQVLAGKKTNEIPFQSPRQVSFVINLKVAKEYGIQVPFQTLSVASRVIR